MKNILVVGGAGYLGGAVTDFLLQNPKYNLRVYDNLMYEESYRKQVDFVYGDILDIEKLKPQLKWADCVIWLAAIVGDGACKLDDILTVKTNQEAVSWLANNYDGRIIFTSTCSVYGAQKDAELNEGSATMPLSLYATTKLNSEKFLANKNALIFRLGTLFGVSDNFSRLRMDLVVNIMTARAHATNVITVFGGEQYRPLIHVKDVGKTISQNIDSKDCGIYNLSVENIKMVDLANRIAKHFPNLSISKTEMLMEDNRNYRVSSLKAKEALNFESTFDLEFGIKELKDILSSGRIKNLNNSRYSNVLFLKEIIK